MIAVFMIGILLLIEIVILGILILNYALNKKQHINNRIGKNIVYKFTPVETDNLTDIIEFYKNHISVEYDVI